MSMAKKTRQRGGNGKMPGGVTGKGFRPGQSGNPKGPAKTRPIKELLEEMGAESLTLTRGGKRITKPRIQWLLDTAWAKAISGDVRWAKEILERLYGKVQESLDVTTKGDRIGGPDLSQLPPALRKKVAGFLGGPTA